MNIITHFAAFILGGAFGVVALALLMAGGNEQTCHDVNTDLANAFECSMCGFVASTSFGQFEYCPGCGARIERGDA